MATALLAGCLGPVAPVASGAAVTLAPASPHVELALEAAPARGAILQVVVSEVRNPEKVPVSIRVTLQDHEKRVAPVDVMRFALFPADQPGRFTGRADQALEQLASRLGARPARLLLTVEFDPAAGAALARPPVEIRVSAAWITTQDTGR
jgi:hypothetical protein